MKGFVLALGSALCALALVVGAQQVSGKGPVGREQRWPCDAGDPTSCQTCCLLQGATVREMCIKYGFSESYCMTKGQLAANACIFAACGS